MFVHGGGGVGYILSWSCLGEEEGVGYILSWSCLGEGEGWVPSIGDSAPHPPKSGQGAGGGYPDKVTHPLPPVRSCPLGRAWYCLVILIGGCLLF